ncbi:DUF1836 domain-containing protein [Heyndrickxia acidicola]|uniref:DUF1836 domain-containing protein n=1 Tax=Heyndrickxia acidicola TaxID=209389 RepID=A0ABU6MB04_9BACI|nr:DUF1836 domain-containing protein [Heyndrickxia acidicola]MED1201609.1 DUF1836 domain-containing protein [Heyndrickxia acidicola]
MKIFQLTRKEMSEILLALKGWESKLPVQILQEAWMMRNPDAEGMEKQLSALITTSLPPIFIKIMKTTKKENGFSLNEIVQLGMQIENTNFSLSAIQNWVKRDIKDIVVSPHQGKKYSLEQTALLFLVEDLKTALDFESIRKLLKLIINDPEDADDDLINPVYLYAAYSTLFEDLNKKGIGFTASYKELPSIELVEQMIRERAEGIIDRYPSLPVQKREAIRNAIVIATLSVFTAYFQMLARRYLSATLFLKDITNE